MMAGAFFVLEESYLRFKEKQKIKEALKNHDSKLYEHFNKHGYDKKLKTLVQIINDKTKRKA